MVQKFLTPHWGNVTPFALTSHDQFLPPGPEYTTLLLLDEEVTDTLTMSATLTDLTKVRAEYWADGPHSETPPGHWLLFAGAACRARGYNLDQSAKLTFALANAELDASIVAWNAKLRWDYARPISAVRTRMKGKLVLAWAGPYKGTRLIRARPGPPTRRRPSRPRRSPSTPPATPPSAAPGPGSCSASPAATCSGPG